MPFNAQSNLRSVFHAVAPGVAPRVSPASARPAVVEGSGESVAPGAQAMTGTPSATPSNTTPAPVVTTQNDGTPRAEVVSWSTWGMALSAAGLGVGVFHGYRRNRGSIGWTLWWGLMGGLFPVITTAVALAQGIGQPAKAARTVRSTRSTRSSDRTTSTS